MQPSISHNEDTESMNNIGLGLIVSYFAFFFLIKLCTIS